MSHSRWLYTIGSGLVLLAVLGFLTVADDARHVDELFQVGTILVAGIALVAEGISSQLSRRLAVSWLVLGLAAGALAGTAVGRVPIGVGAGAVLGLLLGYLRRNHLKAPG